MAIAQGRSIPADASVCRCDTPISSSKSRRWTPADAVDPSPSGEGWGDGNILPIASHSESTTGHSDSLHGHPASRTCPSTGCLLRIQRPSDVLDPGHTRGYIRAGAVLSSYRMVLHPKCCEPGRIRFCRVGPVEDSSARRQATRHRAATITFFLGAQVWLGSSFLFRIRNR